MTKAIFVIKSDSTISSLKDMKFFDSKKLARKHLKNMADERRYKPGVHCFTETDDEFSYLFGWEERKLRFSIVELEMTTE